VATTVHVGADALVRPVERSSTSHSLEHPRNSCITSIGPTILSLNLGTSAVGIQYSWCAELRDFAGEGARATLVQWHQSSGGICCLVPTASRTTRRFLSSSTVHDSGVFPLNRP